MASVNKVILIGYLGQDPTIRYMPDGEAVANVSLATSESWKDKSTGEKQERTEWHRLTFYRRTAEVVGEYCKKGSQIYVEGRLQTRKWTDKDGQDRYTTEIICDKLTMLGSPRGDGETREPAAEPRQERKPAGGGGKFEDMDDDIPFISCDPFADVIWRRLRSARA